MTQQEEVQLERKWHDRINIIQMLFGLLAALIILGTWVGAVEVRLQSVEEYRDGSEPTRIEAIAVLKLQAQQIESLSANLANFIQKYEEDRKADVEYKIQEQKSIKEFYEKYELKLKK